MCLIIFGVIAYVRIIVNNLELQVRMSNTKPRHEYKPNIDI